MNQDEHKIVVRRMAGLIAAASVLIAVYVLRLIFLQLVNSDSFKAQATNTTDYNLPSPLPAATSWTAPDAVSRPAPPATMWYSASC